MRFLVVLGSGTLRNIQPEEPTIVANSAEAPASTGRSSTAAQKAARVAASAQSKVTWVRVELIRCLLG